MQTVKVSGGLPNKLPWVEGIDYEVLAGQPQIGDCVRVRDNTGERFEVVQPAPTPAQPSPVILSKRAFIETASAALGVNGVGRKALGAVLRGMASSVDDEVYTLSQQWESAITLDKAQLAGFMAILAANNIMTAQQRTLILNAWPVA